MSIGKLIRTAREAKELTREQLAKRLALSATYVGHIERDDMVPVSERVAVAVKKVLGVSVAEAARQRHNKKASAWSKAYRARHAKAAAKKSTSKKAA